MNRPFIKGILVISLVFPLFLTSCKKKEAAPPPPAKVQVIEVLQTNVPIPMDYVGQTYGYKDIPIRARVDGFLTGMFFLEGSQIKKGQLLYSIDPEPLLAKKAEKVSALASAEARFTQAESDLNRVRPLAAMNAVSQRDLDAATAQFEAARAGVDAAKAEVKYADINLSYTTIYSPIEGVIGMTQAKVGEYVGRAPNPIVLNEVSSIDSILVKFSISESDFLNLIKMKKEKDNISSDSTKMGVENKATITLVLADGSVYPYPGRFNFANRQVDPQTGTIMFQVSFPNPQRLLRPGQFARIQVILEEVEDGLLIPQRCVRELQGTYQVYVINADNQVVLKNVELGVKVGGMWMVGKGLNPGELVVFEGLNLVRPGQKVEPVKAQIPKDLMNF